VDDDGNVRKPRKFNAEEPEKFFMKKYTGGPMEDD
jgi:hypothetical protein